MPIAAPAALVSMLLLVGPGAESAAPAPLPEPRISEETGVRWYRNVQYVADEEADRVKHRMDLFLPDEENWRPGRPLVIWIHGGGWTMGDKDDAFGLYRAYCRLLAEHGVAAANVSYRLSPQFKFPAHIQDVAAATAWLVERADELGFDARAVFVSGHSAGGHLAALLATDPRWLAAHGLPRDTIAGAIPSSGVFDIRPLVQSGDRWRRVIAQEDAPGASPVVHVDAADPPFALIIEQNGAFLRSQTREMARALEAAGVDQRIVQIPHVNHITMLQDLLYREGVHLMTTLKLIDEVLGERHGDAAPADNRSPGE